jgi:hypothetical protein
VSLRHIENILILLEYAVGIGIVSFEVLGLNSLTSTLFYLTFLLTVVLWLCTLLEEVKLTDLLVLLTIVVALANVLINAALSRSVISFDYLKKLLMFSCTLMFLASSIKMHVKDSTIGCVATMCVVVNIVMTLAYIRQNAAMHLINGQISAYLTFRFTNPNLTALFLSCITIILGLRGSQKEQLSVKLFYYVSAAVQVKYLAETRCRNAMLATVVFFVIFLFLVVTNRRNARMPKWVFAISAVFPILFASAYMMLITSPLFNDLLSFMAGEGKGLSSRIMVWGDALDEFWRSPVFGAYAQISGGTGVSQLHNTHLDVLASYGLFVFTLTCILLYAFMSEAWEHGAPGMRTMALTGFSATLLLGVGEAALFSGGLAIYLFMGFFLIYAMQEQPTGESVGLPDEEASVRREPSGGATR